MSMNHDFIFKNEKTNEVIIKIAIEDSFLDFIDSEIGIENNMFSKILTINPFQAQKPYGKLLPTEKGFFYAGILLVNHNSLSDLMKMFSQWIDVLHTLDSDNYYYDLINLTDDELTALSQEELKILQNRYFEKEVLLSKLNDCLYYSQLLTSSDYILIHEGI